MRTCHSCPKEKLIADVTASLTPRLPARAQQSPSHPAGVAQERLQPARDRKGTAFPPFGTSHQPLVQLTFQRNWGLTCKTGRRDVIPRQPKAGAKFCYGRTACMSFASPLSGLSASRLSLTPSSVSFGNLSCIFLLNRRALPQGQQETPSYSRDFICHPLHANSFLRIQFNQKHEDRWDEQPPVAQTD